MSSKKNTTLIQKSIIIGSIGLGLAFISLAVIPEFFSSGDKGFGYIQLFFVRNGIFFFITGLVLSLFPGTINNFKQTFSNNEYAEERLQHQKGILSFSKHDFILLFLFLIAANFFTIYFIGKENTIYDWDTAHFWSKYMEISIRFYDNPLKAVKSTLSSMQYGEYSYFSTFFLIPFALVFGIERLPYILSVVNIYGFLSALSFLFLYKRFSGIMHDYKSFYGAPLIPLFIFFTFPFIWAPILYGYPALGGFSIMCLILLLYFKFPLSGQRYKTLMIIGILLSVLVLFRRWYSMWAVSFIITLMINEMIFLYIDYGFDRKRLIVLIKKILIIPLTAGLFYILISGPRFLEVATKDYTPLIAIYNPYNLLEHFIGLMNRFGLFYIALTLSGLFVSIYNKNTRKLASFLIIQLFITFVLFTRISYFAFHHYYLLQPTILLFISLLFTTLLLKIKSKTIKIITCSVYCLVSIVIFVAVFFPGASSYAKQAKGLFPQLEYYPVVREDINEIKRMLNVLGDILTDPDDRVYVLSGSELLNSDHFQKARLSLKGIPPVDRHTFRTHDLDLRDGFPSDLFKTKYLVVTKPVKCALGCKKQRVISIAAKSILKGENMGSSYERLPYEFSLQRGVKAYIYKRDDSPVQADMKFLSDALRKHYPNNPHVYGFSVQ